MPNTKKPAQTQPQANTTPDTDPAAVIPTICISVNEQNNNNIEKAPANGKAGVLHCLPEIFTDVDLSSRNELNGKYLKNDPFRSYMFGKFFITFYTGKKRAKSDC